MPDSHDVLHEKFFSELQAIREYVERIPTLEKTITAIASDVSEIKSDNVVLKDVVRGHSDDIAAIKAKISL